MTLTKTISRGILITGLTLSVLLPALTFMSCGSDDSGSSQSEQSVKLTPEQTELVRNYQAMKQIGLAGQVDSFLAMRDSVTVAFAKALYTMHESVIDSAVVTNWAFSWPDVAGLPLVQDTGNGEWRRLVFKIDGLFNKENKARVLYPMILFHKEGNEWKVANASRLEAYKYNPDSSLVSLSQLTFHELFRIPPEFPSLDRVSRQPSPEGKVGIPKPKPITP